MEDLVVKEVATARELRDFTYLPEKVHRDEPNWLPPLYMDEKLLFNKKKNKSYKYADAILFIAYRGSKPVGRIMTLVNNRYNEINKENHGRFCFMECYNEKEVFHALISTAEEWARKIASFHPLTVQQAKAAVLRGLDLPLAEGLNLEKRLARQVVKQAAKKGDRKKRGK